ncbi:multidrug efflux RND transporter permease subunit [Pendulispora brunnea]|uniref:Multidrug efflux RND transporter permease subunit n=1 Tax=Pendulispora brunnea TaxID=2905690 RepID=A0ABZ2KF55_9BACT
MVDFFIRRVVFAMVCAMIIVLSGSVVIPGLPIAQYPNIALPQVNVSANYIGASAAEVEASVTIPLEQQINGVPGAQYITSTSGNDGSSQISITFSPTRDIDLAAVDVQNRVNTALGLLPVDVRTLGVVISKSSGTFVEGVALFTKDDRYTEQFMSNYADVYMKTVLKRIPGVSDVEIFGERRFSMRVWLDPAKLASRGISPSQVVTALREQNFRVAAGSIGAQPAPENLNYQFSVRALGRLVEADDFASVIVKSQPDGTLVRVRDVGRVELGSEDYNSMSSWKGHKTVGLGITQLPGANALEVKKLVEKEIARLAEAFPPGLEREIIFDSTAPVSASIHEVLITLFEAILLVIATIFVFLHGWRATLIPAITIPVSLVGTFIFVKLFGFSINTLTMFGLTLATGLVVDDAIVVIENISRVTEEHGLKGMAAASRGMKEVTSAVIATSLVLIAVFIPVSFFPGTTGKIYQQFSLTIAFSIALSAFNAITLTPALSARLLKGHHGSKWAGFRAFDRVLDAVRRVYGAMLTRVLRHRFIALAAFVGLTAFTGWVYQKVPSGFVPEEDQGWFIIAVVAPEGGSTSTTRAALDKVDAITTKVPEIVGCFSIAGWSVIGGGAPNRGVAFCNLHDWDHRPGKEHHLSAVIDRLREPLMGIGEAMAFPFAPPAIDGVGGFGGFQFEVEDQSGNPSVDDLAASMNKLVDAANKDPRLASVFSSFTANDPQLLVEVDREKAKALDVSLDELFSTLQIYMGSQYVNDFVFGTRTYRVYVQAEAEKRSKPRDIESYYVRSETGQMIPLGNLIHVKQTTSAQTITHYNLFRSVEISGAPAPGRTSGEAMAAMGEVAKRELPPGMAFEWSGLSREELQSGGQTFIIFGLGLVFVFLVLSAQYESFVLPFIIILGVPVGLLGALLGQWYRGYANDVFCQVGLVMMIGLASKNAILIVEFAKELRDKGMPIVQAAIQASETRLRPILMTSIAFLLGLVPLLVATGAGAASRRSLGTAVFGGMALSTVLNIFFIPTLYVLVEQLREWVSRSSKRMPDEEQPSADTDGDAQFSSAE